MTGRIAPPPASAANSGTDPRNCRCGSCGFAYNGYAFSECPNCETDDRGVYALRCVSCRHAFYAAERVDLCPACSSGNTVCVASPDTPAVR